MLNYQRVTCFCLSPSGFPLLNGCTTYLPLIHRGMVFFRNLKISEFGVCFFQYIIQYEFRISAQNHRGRKWWSTIAILTCLEVKGCPRRGSCTERSAKGAEAHGSKTFYMAQVGNGRDPSCQGSFLMFSAEKSRFFVLVTLYIWILNPQHLESNMAGWEILVLTGKYAVSGCLGFPVH